MTEPIPAPDWFIELAKKLLYKLEYGQEYRDAADMLWQQMVTTGAKQIREAQCKQCVCTVKGPIEFTEAGAQVRPFKAHP